MSDREKDSNPILLVLLCFVLFLVLISGVGVYFWLQSLRAQQLRDQAEQAERKAKAEATSTLQSP